MMASVGSARRGLCSGIAPGHRSLTYARRNCQCYPERKCVMINLCKHADRKVIRRRKEWGNDRIWCIKLPTRLNRGVTHFGLAGWGSVLRSPEGRFEFWRQQIEKFFLPLFSFALMFLRALTLTHSR